MRRNLVFTVLGPDRPGLVERVAEQVKAFDGNWQESRLAHIGDQFAGIIQVDVPAEREEAFVEALSGLEATDGLRCQASETASETGEGSVTTLQCVGQDRPGIVFALGDALHDFGVNVEAMDTRFESAPMSGETLFHARFQVRIEPGTDLERLENRLSEIGEELMLDVVFEG